MNKMPMIENNNAFLMAMGEGSRVEIHAAASAKDSWTQINETASAGDVTLTLAEDTGWQLGDKIAIAATGFEIDEAEERTIIAVSDDGLTITLDEALEYDHYGEVETHNNGKSGADFQSWELDMRAEVALLSRNVTIQGDADSTDDGYGGHTMIMNGAEMHIDGAELTRMGQDGILGKYALHWHMLGDASGQYITNSSIHETFNKGMTIHGTQNTWVENNVTYNTVGHSYYFEDGSEFGNVLMNNLGMNTRAAESVAAAAIGSDHTAVSTYWVTNPNNHLIGNHAAGSDEVGFWILSQDHTEGLSAASGLYDDYVPRAQTPGQWVGNTSHSNHSDGIFIGRQFDETIGERVGVDPELIEPFALTDFTTYKNLEVGIWVRNGNGDFTDLKVAESNKGAQIWGASNVKDSLFIGRSGNFEEAPRGEYHGWELYDQAVFFEDVHFDGFDGAVDAALAQGSGFGRSTNYSGAGLTFGDDVPEENIYRGKTVSSQNDGLSDRGGSLAGALHDLDGSITGQAGALITPGIAEIIPNKNADVLNYAFAGIEASGFNATEGAVWLPDSNAWIHDAGSTIGKMMYMSSADEADREDFIIQRADNGARILYGSDTQEGNSRAQLNLDASGEVEYIVSYPDDLPDQIRIIATDLPEGATAFYRFKGLPSDVVLQGATAADNFSAMRDADETSWFRASNGDFLVKIYADRYAWNPPRPGPQDDETVTDVIEAEIYSDEFTIVIDDRASAEPSDNRNPTSPPSDAAQIADPAPLPTRAESTSDTVDISVSDTRWSDASSWDNGVPSETDTVIIGPGQRMVLDADATVKAIIINGGELVVEDIKDLKLAADWILVINGGLFQAGTEDDPFQNDFELTLEGDDAGNDVDVAALLSSTADDIIRADETSVFPTSGADTLMGTNQADKIDALAGNDTINGQSGNDILRGGSGDDALYGEGGNDKLYSGSGDDVVYGGSGNDYIRVGGGVEEFHGGSGRDYLSYYDATKGVTVNLATNEVSGSWAVNDIISGFESVAGSRTGNDLITGTNGANLIRTYGGKDKVYAGKGDDTVELGSGNDYVRVGGGTESFDGGSGRDYISYYDSANGIRIDLREDTVSGSWGVNDTIKDFEGVSGSETGDDILIGTMGTNKLRGYGGDDKLYGRAGADKLYGGDGKDYLDGGAGQEIDLLYGGNDADVFHFDRGEGVDIIKDFENNIDTIELDNFDFPSDDPYAFASQVGSDVVFDFGADGMLTVEDTTIARLQNDLEIV